MRAVGSCALTGRSVASKLHRWPGVTLLDRSGHSQETIELVNEPSAFPVRQPKGESHRLAQRDHFDAPQVLVVFRVTTAALAESSELLSRHNARRQSHECLTPKNGLLAIQKQRLFPEYHPYQQARDKQPGRPERQSECDHPKRGLLEDLDDQYHTANGPRAEPQHQDDGWTAAAPLVDNKSVGLFVVVNR